MSSDQVPPNPAAEAPASSSVIDRGLSLESPPGALEPPAPGAAARRRRARAAQPASGGRDRSLAAALWYRFVQFTSGALGSVFFRWRATGQHHVPASGGVLLVCNHLSYLDVFLLGIPLTRPLNYVARSTLFVPVIGPFIRSVGSFPIQRDGMGASGMKETLRRLRAGGIVTLFPEGTRSPDGQLAPLKSGIAVLVSRAGVPVVPAGLAGTFEVLPRSRRFPSPHPIRIHYGEPIFPHQLAGLDTAAVTRLIHERIEASCLVARAGLARDLR